MFLCFGKENQDVSIIHGLSWNAEAFRDLYFFSDQEKESFLNHTFVGLIGAFNEVLISGLPCPSCIAQF